LIHTLKHLPFGRVASVVAVVLLATGCAVTQGLGDLTRIDYRTAKKAERLDIPPDLVSPRRDDRFAMPGRSADAAAPTTFSAYSRERAGERRAAPAAAAAAASVLPEATAARIERQGEQRWLVVDLPAEKVWPVVRSFWLDSGFLLTTDSAETGVLETDWAETRPPVPDSWLRSRLAAVLGTLYTTGERDRYRTRLEKAEVGNSTEIFISHRGMVEELTGQYKDGSRWVQRRGDQELEAEFLRRLLLRFGGPQGIASATGPSGAAAAVPGQRPSRTALGQSDAGPRLVFSEPFERAWRQVGLALDRSGFTVEDRDRSVGTYFVRYVDPNQESRAQGMLSRVFGGSSERDLSGRRYRIVLTAEGPGQTGDAASLIRVVDDKGAPPADETGRRTATRILTLLQEQLR